MGVCYRQSKRIWQRYQADGAAGLVHRLLFLHDGRNVGRELLKEGLAWWQRSTSSDARLGVIEELARASGKGLWADSNPVPPWKWKAPKKTNQ